ncbi:MAG: NAD(P)H-dependent oxidoreductase subunit E [Oscillospiraceae bacterium]|jgi:NADH:ubiquinone oxidoreductase subunit E|nr:NAD(P)H-dependent oxidoreductase subunit E [Oscillospiraceae bacterium]
MEPTKKSEEGLVGYLLEKQAKSGNAIDAKTAAGVSKETGVPTAKIYGVTTFYAMFSNQARGANLIRMCKSAPCHIKGAKAVLRAFEEALGVACGETTADGKFTLETCECLGVCGVSPAVLINGEVFGNLTPEGVPGLLANY